MGADIHSYFERRTGPGAPWELVQEAVRAAHGDDPDDLRLDVPDERQPLGLLRSSTLFAVLGLAPPGRLGIVYSSFRPVVDIERGLPDDLSPTLREILAEYTPAVGGQYLTAGELLAFPWEETFEVHAYYTREQLVQHRRSGDASGCLSHDPLEVERLGYSVISEPDLLSMSWKAAADKVADCRRYVAYEDWGAPLPELARRMLRLGAPEDVRLVYWFDV